MQPYDPAAFATERAKVLFYHLRDLQALVPGLPLNDETSGEDELDVWARGADDLIRRAKYSDIIVNDEAVYNCFRRAADDLISQCGDGSLRMLEHHLQHYASFARKPVLAMTPDGVERAIRQTTLERFNTRIADAFASYIRHHHQNIAAIARGIYDGSPGGVTAEQFSARFGPAPWHMVNDALTSMGLNYEVIAPNLNSDLIVFAIKRKTDGQAVALSELSSGEQVLLQFALSTYTFDEANLVLTVPKLLLLDEMDASLHPAFVARWITSVRGMAENVGMSVIMTTHSPTTVALAPEGSVFEMTDGNRIPRSVTRQHAIDRLTYGLPVLTIDASARRQVFVESSNDARWYEALAGQLKQEIEFTFGLSFVSARSEKPTGEGGDDAGGCSLARSIVKNLTSEGVPSLFGLLDSDNGRNLPTERIIVLSDRTHYAIENVLLDPLLIGAVLLRGQASAYDYPITLPDLLANDPAHLQKLVNFIVSKVPFDEVDQRKAVPSYYFGGFQLSVPAGFQTMKGHKLSDLVCLHLPCLQRWAGRGRLLDTIIEEVIGMDINLCPQPIADALTILANSEIVPLISISH
jgi:energy-coupling factor transporter ATP-binding protein EcfA2